MVSSTHCRTRGPGCRRRPVGSRHDRGAHGARDRAATRSARGETDEVVVARARLRRPRRRLPADRASGQEERGVAHADRTAARVLVSDLPAESASVAGRRQGAIDRLSRRSGCEPSSRRRRRGPSASTDERGVDLDRYVAVCEGQAPGCPHTVVHHATVDHGPSPLRTQSSAGAVSTPSRRPARSDRRFLGTEPPWTVP